MNFQGYPENAPNHILSPNLAWKILKMAIKSGPLELCSWFFWNFLFSMRLSNGEYFKDLNFFWLDMELMNLAGMTLKLIKNILINNLMYMIKLPSSIHYTNSIINIFLLLSKTQPLPILLNDNILPIFIPPCDFIFCFCLSVSLSILGFNIFSTKSFGIQNTKSSRFWLKTCKILLSIFKSPFTWT